jgi:small subunit ribosomal protein S16
MLMMRLQRVGRKNDPSYRLVVVDKRTGPKSNKHIDHLGSYNPKQNQVLIDGEKVKYWLAQGVQPSDTVYNLLITQKIIEGKKKNVLPRKSPIIDEAKVKAEAEAKAKAEADAIAAVEAAKAAEEAAKVAAATPEPEVAPEVVESTPEAEVEVVAKEEKEEVAA